MKIDRKKVIHAFETYVENYDKKEEKVRLKIEHTYRVSQLCESIACSLKLGSDDTALAWLLGMLHDVGRFELLKNYGTFIDAESIDHARYGAEILFDRGKIRDYIEDDSEDELLRRAVAYHSAYRLPEELTERVRMFCQILRDADKIDILKVNVDFPLEEIYNVTSKELYSCEVTDKVMEAFEEGHAILRSLKKTPADHVVSLVSLVYELVYPRSLFLAYRQGYIEKIVAFESENPKTREQFVHIRKVMGEYLERKQIKPKEYQNYIFDLYGTLVDIHTNESKASLWKNMACIFSMMGADYDEAELKRAYKQAVKEELDILLPRMQKKLSDETLSEGEVEILLDNVFHKLLEVKGIQADQERISQIGITFRSLSMSYINLYEGAAELLARLKNSGKKVYLLSNAQRVFTEPEMRMLGIYELFEGILYSSDAGVKKPSFHFYDQLFHKYGLKKEESVMIGNEYRADILGAENYGIDSMYVFTAQSGAEPACLPACCRKIKSISEVFE